MYPEIRALVFWVYLNGILKCKRKRRKIPTYVLTIRTGKYNTRESYACGAHTYLMKIKRIPNMYTYSRNTITSN